jgi:hypothetical protein
VIILYQKILRLYAGSLSSISFHLVPYKVMLGLFYGLCNLVYGLGVQGNALLGRPPFLLIVFIVHPAINKLVAFVLSNSIGAKQYKIYSDLFIAGIMTKGIGLPRLPFMVALVRYYYFPPGDGWRRFKICKYQQCKKWFVDGTKNRAQDYCSFKEKK